MTALAMGCRGWRRRGFVRLRGGSFQVLDCAGPDPLAGKDTYISEPTRDRRQVEKVRTRLLAKVDQQRTNSTKVTLGYTLDAWLQVHEADERTLEGYRGYTERTIKPALGDVSIAKVSARVLEQFYAQLRRCRTRCNGKAYVEHFTDEVHECDQVVHRRVRAHDCAAAKCRVLACKPHQCKPMSASTVRRSTSSSAVL
ncbi:hypothetical protein [Actinopolymorpha pittospori]